MHHNADIECKINGYIRGVFVKYVDKCNRMRIKYTTRMEFCINQYQLLNI